jgi:hypothetical protein
MTLDELDDLIEKRGTIRNNRFSVKVILLNNFDDSISLKNIFNNRGYSIKDLRDFQQDENSWFGLSKLTKIIEDIEENTLLFSISEVVRFFNKDDFQSFFTNILSLEKREFSIFIPLFGLSNRFFAQFFNNFYRRDEDTLFYKIDGIKVNYRIDILDFNIENSKKLSSIKEWLGFYEKPVDGAICTSPKIANKIENNKLEELFSINQFKNEKEYLEEIFKISIPLNYEKSEQQFWSKLLENFIKDGENIESFLKKSLNLFSLNSDEDILIEIEKSRDLFQRWLLKLYISERENRSYFNNVVLKTDINQSLISSLWFSIFENYELSFIEDRFNLIKEFYKDKTVSIEIEQKLEIELSNFNGNHSKIIIGISKIEREWIVKLFQKGEVDSIYLEKYYSDLFYYLKDIEVKNSIDWVSKYFKEYKLSKINNEISKNLQNILEEKNSSKSKFYSWFNDHKFKYHDQLNEKNILWIDGFGAEWISLTQNIIKEFGYEFEIFLSTAKLPTITKCNKFFSRKVDDLDKYIHSQKAYSFPKDLVNEIDIVKNILKENLKENLLIVSDHGFSPFSSFKGKINSFENDEHEGRCAKTDLIINDNNYFSDDFECGRYIVSLTHNSLNNKTRRESHGGATPEEVIVPIIRVSKKINNSAFDKKDSFEKTKEINKERKGFEEEELF